MPVVDEERSPRRPLDWQARYRLDPDGPWGECRVVDITLTTATLELADESWVERADTLAVEGPFSLPAALAVGGPFSLQIDTIAEDDVGITMQAAVCHVQRSDRGPVVEIEFRARREEQLLLHLLVRLRALA